MERSLADISAGFLTQWGPDVKATRARGRRGASALTLDSNGLNFAAARGEQWVGIGGEHVGQLHELSRPARTLDLPGPWRVVRFCSSKHAQKAAGMEAFRTQGAQRTEPAG
jgi:hypothetical protein